MIGVFIVDLDKLKAPDWQTLPLGALMSGRLWSTCSLAFIAVKPEDRQKVYEEVTRIQEGRDASGGRRAHD